MTSPRSTGGAGIHLESWIAADYLAATLTRGAVRGLSSGAIAAGVKLQRAFEGAPLDDAIVSAATAAGTATLSLQAKRTLAFGDNALFREVMAQCWQTFADIGFRPGLDRFGVAMGTPDARFESTGRNGLTWARQSRDAADFLGRIDAKGVASDAMRGFVAAVRGALIDARGSLDRAALVEQLQSEFCLAPARAVLTDLSLAPAKAMYEDRVVYRLPRPRPDGRTVLSLTPLELIDGLAAAPGDPRPWRRPALFPTRRSPPRRQAAAPRRTPCGPCRSYACSRP